jgi:hypothetical protein
MRIASGAAHASEAMQHSIAARKHPGYGVAGPEPQQGAWLLHAVGSHADAQASQQTESPDSNRRVRSVRPDHDSNHQVFVRRYLTRRVRLPGLGLIGQSRQSQQEQKRQSAAGHIQDSPKGTKISAVQLVISAKSLANFRSSHGLSSHLRAITSPPTRVSQTAVTISAETVASMAMKRS